MDNNSFSVSILLPQQIELNKEFTITAYLKNESKQDYAIESRQHIFYYLIKDSTGKGINSIVLPDMGVARIFPGSETITEKYTYKITEPGVYSVSAVAEFTVGEGENRNGYKIETEPGKLEVIRKTDNQ
ncbi:hypothetical protein D3C77_418590 [compost metagenome]